MAQAKYNNIIDIYRRLITVSLELEAEGNPNIKGFDYCLMLLRSALREYDSLNMHLEVKQLRRALEQAEYKVSKLKLKVDDLTEDNQVLAKRNRKLERRAEKRLIKLQSA